MDELFRDTSSQSRSACTECQRRKQKCNREWPCNHCQKRKVADKCRFNQPNTTLDRAPQDTKKKALLPVHAGSERDTGDDATGLAETSVPQTTKKRSLSSRDDYEEGGDSNDGEDLGLGDLGYMATHQFASLGLDVNTDQPVSRQFWVKPSACAQLERAVDILPKRPHMDALVQNFFDNVNYHYYIIYPPAFLQEYQDWWQKRSQNRSLSLQWTCLLLMICSCASQHLPVDMQEKLELEMGQTAQNLTETYHNMARELASAIPVGYYHMYNVQWLLHSCYWFKSEARFLECWHVLGAAAREAQELGLHRKETAEHLPEFDREMRRRVWCVVDTWDWQISSGLFRPSIIDRTDCNVDLPTLTLEEYTPSPLMHMKLQSELIRRLAKRFSTPRNINTPEEAQEYKSIIDEWMLNFPPAYALKNPDQSGDKIRPWITFHRHYIHTMGYMMLLNPLRSYMSSTFTKDSPADLVAIRAMGVDYSLRLIDVLQEWVDFVSYRDGRFHFIIFSLFDTAAVLSTAVIKDMDSTIPSRKEIYVTIDTSLALLKRLMALSITAKMSYDILVRIVRKVPRPAGYRTQVPRKRHKVAKVPASVAPVPAPVQVPALVQAPAQVAPDHPPYLPPHAAHVHHVAQTTYAARDPHGPAQALAQASAQAHVQAYVQVPSHVQYIPQTSYDEHAYTRGLGYESMSPEQYIVADNSTNASTPQSDFIGVHGLTYSTASESTPPSVDENAGSPNSSINSLAGNELVQPGMFNDISPLDQALDEPLPQDLGFDTITDVELGGLATLWNWQSLNLDFISSEAATAAAQQPEPPVSMS